MNRSKYEQRIPYRPPFDWTALTGFLARRAIEGVEHVGDRSYRRTVREAGESGTVELRLDAAGQQVVLTASAELGPKLPALARRVRRLFDLDADSGAISSRLGRDPVLAPFAQTLPGIRLPGSWDPFETSVRAIVGQVVSVPVATTLMTRLVMRHGESLEGGAAPGLSLLFPRPERLAEADLSGIGLSRQKREAIRALAGALASGQLRLEATDDLDGTIAELSRLPGVGPWTANYIAMRALGAADAFPAGDLILRRAAAAPGETLTRAKLLALAEGWRPYRAYAAVLLWTSYSPSAWRSK